MGNDNLLYASRISTLEDFVKTDISKDKSVYCSFQKEEFTELEMTLGRECQKKGIKKITFNNGEEITNFVNPKYNY